jgi:formamidopyrimidine-DNA glycosylase
MPELPEVEVTARALSNRLAGSKIDAVRVHNRALRVPIARGFSRQVLGQSIRHVGRRGKYLLWQLDGGVIISHLGMSGSWRIHDGGAWPTREAHDHVEIACGNALARLNDPRRFGALLWHARRAGDVLAHPLLARLGIEPFDARFDGAYLHAATRGRRTAIKQLLLAGKIVVGVGNIYATESLFGAGIDPRTPAGRLSPARCEALAQAIRDVLARAIDAGGSTLRDFSNVDGLAGRYTLSAAAYDRVGEPCPRCGTRIRRIVQGQRATYFCPRCQSR